MKKARLILASTAESADMLYASGGFQAHDPFIYFECGSEKAVVVSKLEYSRALNECPESVKVYDRDEFLSDTERRSGNSKVILRIAERKKILAFEVPSSFPLAAADFLRDNNLKIAAVSGEFFPERQIKKSDEIKKIKAALRLAEEAVMRAALIIAEAKINKNGTLGWNGGILTSEILRSEINLEIVRGGGIADSTIASSGTDSAQPHNIGYGPIRAGVPIVLDIFPRMQDSGYWGDITRTFVKGKAPVKIKRAFEAVKEARDTAKEYVKEGISGSKAHEIALSILEKHNFPTGSKGGRNYGFIHGLGHAVGLEIHESPRLSPFSADIKLKKGQVLTVEPGVYYPEWGGIRLEDMVVVKKDSCECLNSIETTLEIP